MVEVQGALVKKYEDIKGFFLRKDVVEQMNAIIPKIASAERMLRIALGVVRQNEKILACEKASILAGIISSLQLGLSLDPALKEAHLVPFFNNQKRISEAVFIPDYRGYLSLARRAGEVASVSAHPVYMSDQFEIVYGTNKRLEHIPNEKRPDNDPIRGAYIVYFFKTPGVLPEFDYMPWMDIEKRMNVSKAKQTGPWKEWTEEMAVKTVIRHSIKTIGISSDLARAAELEERHLIGESQTEIVPLLDMSVSESSELPPIDTTEFENKVKEFIKPDEKLLWEEFFQQSAETLGMSPPDAMMQMGKDFSNVLKAYQTWKAGKKK